MEYKATLKETILFEMKSIFGRYILKSKPVLGNSIGYLNLGSGADAKKGFVNADFYCTRFWRKKEYKIDWMLDLRYPLNCDSEIFRGVYSSHAIEHLYPDEVAALLKELFRIMKLEATIRIAVPDLKKYIDYYNGTMKAIDKNEFMKRFSSPCSAIFNITQNYLHHSVWDYAEIKRYLEDAGFRDVAQMSFKESRDEKLSVDIADRNWESLYVEAVK